MSEEQKITFEAAGAEKESGLFRELILMMRENKKYWLIPLVLMLLLFAVLLTLGSSVVAPFIYTIF